MAASRRLAGHGPADPPRRPGDHGYTGHVCWYFPAALARYILSRVATPKG